MRSSVIEFFEGKNVLITGGTGFIGKVLIEKLLRSCPGICTIYLFLREKKGVSEEERLKILCSNAVFDNLHQNQPEVFKKLKIVSGDILADDLGLSHDDRQELKRNCNIVFHVAASVRFDLKLKAALDVNTRGTLRVLRLAETMEKLEVFVHVSTAYCRCELPVLEEKLYPSTHDPEKIMNLVDVLDDATLDYIEPKLITPEPNTYAYTKALTEDLVAKFSSKFPIAIGRPSIVTASWKEPMPGWIDNLNGPTGVIVGTASGLLRTMLCELSNYSDCIPSDVIVNGCILIAYTTALDKPKNVCIYNMTSSDTRKVAWKDIVNPAKHWIDENPLSVALWYPHCNVNTSWLKHNVELFFFQLLPAYFVDILLFLSGRKPFVGNLQKRIIRGMKILEYYTMKQWTFKSTNFLSLKKRITESENEIFFTDMTKLDITEYLKTYVIGIRLYVCKEDPSTLPRARRLHRILYVADVIVKILFYLLLLWILFFKIDIINLICSIHNIFFSLISSESKSVELREL